MSVQAPPPSRRRATGKVKYIIANENVVGVMKVTVKTDRVLMSHVVAFWEASTPYEVAFTDPESFGLVVDGMGISGVGTAEDSVQTVGQYTVRVLTGYKKGVNVTDVPEAHTLPQYAQATYIGFSYSDDGVHNVFSDVLRHCLQAGPWPATPISSETVGSWRSREAHWTAVRPSNIAGAGNGLFARIDIPSQTILGKYGGKVMTNNLAGISTDYTISIPSSGITVDGRAPPSDTNQSTAVRYINDVDKSHTNVAFFDLYVIALRDIAKDEELYVSYSEQYWNGRHRKREGLGSTPITVPPPIIHAAPVRGAGPTSILGPMPMPMPIPIPMQMPIPVPVPGTVQTLTPSTSPSPSPTLEIRFDEAHSHSMHTTDSVEEVHSVTPQHVAAAGVSVFHAMPYRRYAYHLDARGPRTYSLLWAPYSPDYDA